MNKPTTADSLIGNDRLDTIYGFYPIASSSNLILILLMGFVLWPLTGGPLLHFWLGISALSVISRFWALRLFKNHRQRLSERNWLALNEIMVIFSGSVWAFCATLLIPHEPLPPLLMLIIATAGLCSGASNTLALVPRAFLYYLLLMLVPMSFRLLHLDADYGVALFILCFIYMFFMWTTCLRNSKLGTNNIHQAHLIKDKEKALNTSSKRLDLQFAQSPLGAIEWSTDLRVTRWNKAAEGIFGFSEQEMLNNGPQRLSSAADSVDPDHEQSSLYFDQLQSSKNSTSATIRHTTREGQTISCEWISIPLEDTDHSLLGYTSFITDITERLERENLITQQAHYDAVTGLPNRHNFQQRLAEEVSRVSRTRLFSAVLFIDLDDFKTINDTLGHAVGDELLQQFSERLVKRMRQYDMLARFGGDEFVILLSELDENLERAQIKAAQVADSLLSIVQQPFQLSGNHYSLTCSVGISLFNTDQQCEDELLKQADLALYQSKRNGRNQYTFFEQEMGQQASRHLELLGSLRKAIANQELYLAYQPKVSMKELTLNGAEALVRWNSKEHGFVPPGEFIPIVENSTLMPVIGYWILDEAFCQLAQWLQEGIWQKPMRLAINISPQQLLEPDFQQTIGQLLSAHHLPSSYIEFEITENVLIGDTDKVTAVLIALSEMGISFSIDDFGTGYSSLAYLKKLPIDVLKIDKSFIDHCTEEGNDQAIIRSILSICNELNLTSVAEGVETKEQQQKLAEMGCDTLQGYYFSRPIDPQALKDLLLNSNT